MSQEMEKQVPDEKLKIGVYICHCGGNISDVVNVKKLAGELTQIPGVTLARTNMFMCSDVGQGLIMEDIKNEGINRVVVASCSPRLHGSTFRNALVRAGLNPYLYEHANVREQVSWVTHHDPQSATVKAARLVAAAVAKAKLLEPLDPIRVKACHEVAIIGGGVSGLRSALDLSRQGIRVTLIEKSPFLGGHMAQLGAVFPSGIKAREILTKLIEEVRKEPDIRIITCATVSEVTGNIGEFHLKVTEQPRGVTADLEPVGEALAACPVSVKNEFEYGTLDRKAIYLPYPGCFPTLPAIDWQTCTRCGKCLAAAAGKGIRLDDQPHEIDLQAGILLVASGYNHYEPARGEYGYDIFPEVITLPQLIRIMENNPPGGAHLEWKGQPIKNIAMIHCVGSRQIEGIDQPAENHKLNPYCSRVCCTATLQAAREIQERFPGTNIYDLYRDIRTYGRGHENYYEESQSLFFRFVPESRPVVEQEPGGASPLLVKVKDQLTYNTEIEIPVDLVVLAVGMLPQDTLNLSETLKLPVGADGFFQEVHPKLRPVESSINGILLAGTCQGPKDITESCAAASAAAAKAAAKLSRDYIELDPYVAKVDEDRCTGCGKCLAECSYPGTITLKELTIGDQIVKKAVISPSSCKGCGACAAVCEPRAINVNGWTLDQFDAMVDALAEQEIMMAEAVQ
jgi:heterodisulfide reductase subunit A2